MDSLVCNAAEKQTTKAKLIEYMEQNDLKYNLVDCCGCERFCIDFSDEETTCPKHCCNSGIIVQTSSKDVCRVYPHNILYIAIENRKSVLYLTDRRVETNYQLDYWKDILNLKTFAQPHHSFIVNLKYVDEVTKDFVIIRYGEKEYQVYTSLRKIGAFKKALLDFGR